MQPAFRIKVQVYQITSIDLSSYGVFFLLFYFKFLFLSFYLLSFLVVKLELLGYLLSVKSGNSNSKLTYKLAGFHF